MDSRPKIAALLLPHTVYKVAHLLTLPEWTANFGPPWNAGGPTSRLG
jgi:hypothetical protein